MSRYIITGAVGHLASIIIGMLKKDAGNEIFGLILPSENALNEKNVTYKAGDVTDLKSLDDFFAEFATPDTFVIHAAAIIAVDDKISPILYKVNVEGTKNVLEVSKKYKIKRLVYVSSIDALGEIKKGEIGREVPFFDEEKIKAGYGKTKAIASNMVLKASKEGIETVVVQPSCIFGPDDPGSNAFNTFLKMCLLHKMPVSIKGGIDLVDVRDVANGCILACKNGKSGECYILSNRYFSLDELEEYTRKEVGGFKKMTLPLGIVKAFVPFLTLYAKLARKRPLVTQYSLNIIGEEMVFSHEKADKDLGYTVHSMKESIHDMNEWLKTIR